MIDPERILDLETAMPGMPPKKYTAILHLGISAARYYQQVARILETPELLEAALKSHPTTTNRLLRQRDERAAARKARSL